ncbi:uncharacterized protein [Nicotiana sylvestris]|uniref:uncharacterized protein n=1 Tax=Nicotiana sylvestris TaxID=4096 RepID=UPI00388C507A
MVRTRATGRGRRPPVPPAEATRGRGLGRGRVARAEPINPPAALAQDQAPAMDAPAAPAVPIAVSTTTAAATSQVRGGNHTPAAHTPEQVVQGLPMSGAPPAQPVAPAQEFVVPVMPDDEQRRFERDIVQHDDARDVTIGDEGMVRTRATGRGGRPPVPPAEATRVLSPGRGRVARAAPIDPPAALAQDQAPAMDAPAAPVQAPAVPIVIPGLQEALA